MAEIAELAGVDKGVVGNWVVRRPTGFPEPYATLRAGTIYVKSEIERWLEATGRNPL